MDHSALERTYLAKTDDELLALFAERRSLEAEAQSVLWSELRRRKLTDSHLLHPRISDEAARPNLAFNLPAKVGAAVMLLVLGTVGLTLGIAAAREHQFFNLVLIFGVFWGPIFATIALGNAPRPLQSTPFHRRARARADAKNPLVVRKQAITSEPKENI